MRMLGWLVIALLGGLAALHGCDGRPLRYPPVDRGGGRAEGATTGAAGTAAAGVATGGTTGAAGLGDAGGAAAAGAAAGATADSSGSAIAAAGTGVPPSSGEAGGDGALPPMPAPCDSLPKKPLPYAIEADFSSIVSINNPGVWTTVGNPDCEEISFPSPPAPPGWPMPGPSPACFEFIYNPDLCVGTTPDLCWAGAIFEIPPALGPGGSGICIEDGATMVEFRARSSRDGARVKFGSIRPGLGSTEFFFNLATTWTRYTVPIPADEPYDTSALAGGVWNGFSVVAEPQDHAGGSYILVKDIRWLK